MADAGAEHQVGCASCHECPEVCQCRLEGRTLGGARVARVRQLLQRYYPKDKQMESVVSSTCNVVLVKNAEPSSELQQLEWFFAMCNVVLVKHANSHVDGATSWLDLFHAQYRPGQTCRSLT